MANNIRVVDSQDKIIPRYNSGRTVSQHRPNIVAMKIVRVSIIISLIRRCSNRDYPRGTGWLSPIYMYIYIQCCTHGKREGGMEKER